MFNEYILAENKTQGSTARSTDSPTAASETEEQLLGVGNLPRGNTITWMNISSDVLDIKAEQDMEEAIKKAIGPPEPILE